MVMNHQNLQFSLLLFLAAFNNLLNSSSVLLVFSVASVVAVTTGSNNPPIASEAALTIPEQSKNNLGIAAATTTTSSVPSHHHRRQRRHALLDDTGNGIAKIVETSSDSSSSESLGSSTLKAAFVTENEDRQVSLTSKNMSRRIWKYRGGIGITSHAKATILTMSIAVLWIPILLLDGDAISTKFPFLSWLHHKGSSSIRILRWIVVFLYLIECMICSTRRYLSNSLTPMELDEYIQNLIYSPPQISWFIDCYHYRTVHMYSQTREGNARRSTSQEKVITHRARKDFEVPSWRDATESTTLKHALEFVDNKDMKGNHHQGTVPITTATTTFVKATISKLFVFANPEILSRYNDEETLFCATEGRRDVYYDFRREISLRGSNFRHKILVIRTGLSDIRFASKIWFWLFSLVGLTVPYRVWFANHCYNSELTVTKIIDM